MGEATSYVIIRADFILLHQEVMQICTTLRGTFDNLRRAHEAAARCRKLLEGVAKQESKIARFSRGFRPQVACFQQKEMSLIAPMTECHLPLSEIQEFLNHDDEEERRRSYTDIWVEE